MANRRVRLNDQNDPLSSTDKVLAGFEQVSQSTSQEDNKLASQQDKMPSFTPSPQTNNRKNKSASQQANQPTSQEDNYSNSHKNSNLTRQQVDTSTSQQVKPEKATCRKSTFQINEEVLHLLDIGDKLRKRRNCQG
jgi:hypothetical protein